MSDRDTQNTLAIGQKLRAARKKSGFSLRELAARAEVSASLLSQIENGKANPSVRSLHSISDALSVPITYFFPEEAEEEAETATTEMAESVPREIKLTPSELRSTQEDGEIERMVFGDGEGVFRGPVVRAEMRPVISLEGGVTWSRLTPGPEEGVEFLLIQYEVGASSGAKMSHHTGREFTYVLEGELLLELGFEKYLLQPGDSFIFDSTTPHRLSNVGDVPMRAITMIFKETV